MFKHIAAAKLPWVDHVEELKEDEGLENYREGAKLICRLVKNPLSALRVSFNINLVRVQWISILIYLKVEDEVSEQEKHNQ